MRTSIPASFRRARWRRASGARVRQCPAEQGFRSFVRSAEHGFGSFVRSAEHGFTLIELMVVIAIIGFVSATVILAMPDPRGRVIEDADRFAARVAAARDNAVIQARPMSVWISASGYGFEQRGEGAWQPLDDKPFVTTSWREGTSALVGEEGRAQLSFDSTGLPSEPLVLRLLREGEQVSVTVDMAGKVHVGG
ncbi:GspH/FimT family pseudopilin [Sphingobium sp. H39-3-25]|nr:GspH/FimT family pseudopilin [Sphingobium arseniciresistens]